MVVIQVFWQTKVGLVLFAFFPSYLLFRLLLVDWNANSRAKHGTNQTNILAAGGHPSHMQSARYDCMGLGWDLGGHAR